MKQIERKITNEIINFFFCYKAEKEKNCVVLSIDNAYKVGKLQAFEKELKQINKIDYIKYTNTLTGEQYKSIDKALNFADIDGCNVIAKIDPTIYDKSELIEQIRNHKGGFPFNSPYWLGSLELRNNREVFLEAIVSVPEIQKYNSIPPELRNDKDIIKAAVNRNNYLLQYSTKKMKDNKEVVLTAVSKWGYQLIYASYRLRNDKDIIKAAIDNYDRALLFAADLRNDKEIVLYSISKLPTTILFASFKMQENADVVKAAMIGGYKCKYLQELESEVIEWTNAQHHPLGAGSVLLEKKEIRKKVVMFNRKLKACGSEMLFFFQPLYKCWGNSFISCGVSSDKLSNVRCKHVAAVLSV